MRGAISMALAYNQFTRSGHTHLLSLSAQWCLIPISKKHKKEPYEEELEERVILMVASSFGE